MLCDTKRKKRYKQVRTLHWNGKKIVSNKCLLKKTSRKKFELLLFQFSTRQIKIRFRATRFRLNSWFFDMKKRIRRCVRTKRQKRYINCHIYQEEGRFTSISVFNKWDNIPVSAPPSYNQMIDYVNVIVGAFLKRRVKYRYKSLSYNYYIVQQTMISIVLNKGSYLNNFIREF